MITVKPIEDNIRKEQLLSKYHCSADDSTILVMKDGVCELGYAAIDLIQGKLLIRNIFLTKRSVQELNAKIKFISIFSCVLRHRMEPITVRIKWKTVWRNCIHFLYPKGLFWNMEYVPFQSAKLYTFAIRIIPKRKDRKKFLLVFSCLSALYSCN